MSKTIGLAFDRRTPLAVTIGSEIVDESLFSIMKQKVAHLMKDGEPEMVVTKVARC